MDSLEWRAIDLGIRDQLVHMRTSKHTDRYTYNSHFK